jgi:hypothetical protein
MRTTALVCLLVLLCGAARAAPVMHEPGWTITSFAPVAAGAQDGEVDASGNLYVACGQAGVFRFTPSGSSVLWSSAEGDGLAMLPTGEAYLPSRDIFTIKYIWHIQADGTYSPLVSGTSPSWVFAAISSTGILYANVNGIGKGIYQIDRLTGAFTPFHSGGPGIGGIGIYSDMATTSDGTLYACCSFAPGIGLFRIDGSTSTQLLSFASGMSALCRGPSDTLFSATYTGTGPGTNGQVWKLDVATATATPFASGFGATTGVVYDPSHDRFYVIDQTGKIWAISHDQTPAHSQSWGSVKTAYR